MLKVQELFYIEVCLDDKYILQSKWFESENEAILWAKGIDYLDIKAGIYLMKTTTDFSNKHQYGDIIQVREIRTELNEDSQ